ncbi:hypothetical protein ElyMa_006025800 [Elysia marginata]|uniref:Uncharacterized protein n=1 Tax=Elysia marginata TaxID=1093978 RepID=A0AAV4GJ57_9GAST|nr:hypothetical protein ElyMa_006025800 [Elysia marginata]
MTLERNVAPSSPAHTVMSAAAFSAGLSSPCDAGGTVNGDLVDRGGGVDGKTPHYPAPCVVDANGGTSLLRKDEPMYSRNSPNMLNILSATSDLEFSNRVDRLCGLAVRHSLRDQEVRGLIPGRVKPRTIKLVLTADPPS